MTWDVVIVGAGAAGLLAGIRASERGLRTLLLEKNARPGVKILMSGGTRCNLTHATDARGIVEAYGRPGRFLHSALATLSPDELIELFANEGVATKVEDTGKVFPVSNRAADVLAALMERLQRSGCQLNLNEPLTKLSKIESGFELRTSNTTYESQNVIVTTGGKSYPGSGTTGDGYAWLEQLGHTIVPPRPSLTPVTTDVSWVAKLKGVTIPKVGVGVVPLKDIQLGQSTGKQKPLAEACDSFLFTHFGLSGPAILDVSRAITGHDKPRELALRCDFVPYLNGEQLFMQLRQECQQNPRKQIVTLLPGWLPRRLAETLVELLDLTERRAAELSNRHLRQLATAMKETHIPISGTRGFKKAEVTAGGVALKEVDSSTMQSKLVAGLYLAGEILDLDGPIGGYNFQAAFSTAWLAGSSVEAGA
ncbi:BaiN/RdsA family NAD(P)/FAD-dependent oxidoreductase [Adhaeretor mobilis]|uniref:N-methyltryptophan oxidase n=1 Tax=Adhaeretor mobilis TaxID=1930276 RepID=A0A517MR17_9BACT|nr:NAD(P)/FAD-dependent oxidoreductase [Adhaeretor mobilis]QDS97319.1 N-methyltryptophan oxidase [Adhaeretor mobilis]